MQLSSLFRCSFKPYYKSGASCSQTTPPRNPPIIDGAHADNEVKFPKNIKKPRGEKGRIREALLKVEHAVSSYDTAWVAMVPSPRFTKFPCFPQCIEWILDNQHPDGSWGLRHSYHPSLIKDVLSSTLACILALQRWSVGEEHVKRGLHFIGSNFSHVTDESLQSPIGFNIIFPGMIGHAVSMGLNLPMCQSDVDAILSIRDLELNRLSGDCSEGGKAYYAYVAEGVSKQQDWEEVMKYQQRNGSLFSSPSTTASAVIHTRDEKALSYLRSLLQKFGNSVPTIYPRDIYTHLHNVDALERTGVSRHFSCEIECILDKIYRCWLHKDEEITSDPATCAMAFRILRMNGYDVSSDALAQFDEIDGFNSSVQGHLRDVSAVLELYRASQVKTLPNERVLDKIQFWSSCYLKEDGVSISEDVDHALKFPLYADLDRLEHRRHIEHFDTENIQLLKSAYIIDDKDVLNLAVGDFHFSQSMYRKELEAIESWVEENKLDQLEFARQRQAFCYFSAAATVFSPEVSDARSSWAKAGVLTLVIDDFFDVGGSRDEQVNLITLVERWDDNYKREFCSKQVRILFLALYNTVNELGAKASALQKRNVTSHMIEIWLRMMEAMMKEAEWARQRSIPTMDDYITNACYSFALEPMIIPTLYFLGPELSDNVIRGSECHRLLILLSKCGRLLNDIQSFERERKQGKLNSLSLHILHGGGSTSEDEGRKQLESVIRSNRRELLRLVLLSDGTGVVPRACKDVFWKMSKVLHLFYATTDGLTSLKEMNSALNAVIHEPLNVDHLQLSVDT